MLSLADIKNPDLLFSLPFVGPCNLIFGICMVICLSIYPITYFFIGRKFDRLFKWGRPILGDSRIPIVSSMQRTLAYSMGIVFNKRMQRNKLFNFSFQHYNFPGNCTTFERVLAYIFIYSGVTCVIFMIPWAILYGYCSFNESILCKLLGN